MARRRKARPAARKRNPVLSEPAAPARTPSQVVHDYLAGRRWQELVKRARASALRVPLPLGPGGLVCACDPRAPTQCTHRDPDIKPPSKRELFIAHTEWLLWDAARRATDPTILRQARHLQEINRGVTRPNERPRLYDPRLVALAHAALTRKVPNPTWVYGKLAKALKVSERTIRRLVAEGRPAALPPKESRGKR